jgi:hypothetical protein
MQNLLPLILLGLIAAVFPLSAGSADEKDRGKTGSGASTEGGASLGGTGIDSGISNQRGADDPDRRLKLHRKPKPVDEPRSPSIEPGKPPAAEPRKPSAEADGASTGATKPRGSLSDEADRHDEEFRRKQDAQRRK